MFPGMKPLVKRAIRLVKRFKDRGHKVIEVFPRASEHILGLERSKRANEHVYDALLCALTGLAYLRGEYEDLEGIIIPK
jgi:predicted nuclease with RNAse H fold